MLSCDVMTINVMTANNYDKQNRCLNPTKGDLNNLLYSLNKSQGATKFDQKDLNELYENLQVDGHFVFYQPYHSKNVSYFCSCKF